jgi:3-methyladenine DNA glycosylase AlkC
MSEPLKNMYNAQFFEHLCPVLKDVVQDFSERRFVYRIFDSIWPELKLKQRTRKVTLALAECLPSDYPKAIEMVVAICQSLQKIKDRFPTYSLIFLPDYIEIYGLDNFDLSMEAIEESTKLVSAEFAIRPFIKRYPIEAMGTMLKWSKHSHPAVRRLSSEGCRPRLPWGMGIPRLKNDPSPILPILENLKTDPSDSVRRSVANNLNDIAKDHPDCALALAVKWRGVNPETDWIIKHGCRTLLKRGHPAVLSLHGFSPKARMKIKDLVVPKEVRLGNALTFQFVFVNKEKRTAHYRIDYALDYLTRSGKTSRKIFKLSERAVGPGEEIFFTRKKSFKDFTTRKHCKGKHRLQILANGVEVAEHEFLAF